ncbi:PREDICTED: methylmalonate-semialdehyde dehydrogenase [acylating], mitochondrial-like isoform X2 [Tarenaya hassleriana]|uniref:methylmalonate-semialdehyde dehydrogenase [acylating], mitochondrial-like isoform X2 n=1 Tax=Tarenaya hassleriana TaxID=28532 RepID=UPI00053C60E8|nr:PREDICTED: methylmalonate-semialdehyde dehydrogenase [acylating], mitochondrial-like isoform X2 [Tarenaya hassleriana]
MMDIDSQTDMELSGDPQMLPPTPGTFVDREELIQHVGEFAVSQGYVVTIKQSKKDKVVVLGCDRGGVYRDRRKSKDQSYGEPSRKRKIGSRLTNCPFECVGKKDDGLWVLILKNGTHNHEPIKDISEHPAARRFSEKEVLLIKEMTEAGLKPRQILKRLKQNNPELLSTPKHVYNIKAKLRQGNTTVRMFKSLKPEKCAARKSHLSNTEPSWRQCYPQRISNLIGGRFVDSESFASIDVINPATQQVISQVSLTTNEEFRAAVFAAKRAFPSWKNTPLNIRQRIMFRLQELIERDLDKLAMTISTEHGKPLKYACDDVVRGLEALEYTCGLGSLQVGEFVSNSSDGVDSYSTTEPLGVCAGICSFDFPAMIPLWMFSISVMCGNTYILKPSEKDPGAAMLLAELAVEAGLPSGVLNIVHGTNDIINSICDDNDVKAVSFVGPKTAAVYVHTRASATGKRVLCNVGGKHHAVIMHDASMDTTVGTLVAAGFGCAGQKCVAICTVIFVGNSTLWVDKLVEHAKALRVTAGTEPCADVGPLISKQAQERMCRLIQTAVEAGARLVLDGRNTMVHGYEQGNFIGPTILTGVTTEMECYKEELHGPVLLCMQVDSLEKAIEIINQNKHGQAASIFTTSAMAARKFQTDIEVGQIGINVPASASFPYSSLMTLRPNFSSDLSDDGKTWVEFYTKTKRVRRQWGDLQIQSEGTSSHVMDAFC